MNRSQSTSTDERAFRSIVDVLRDRADHEPTRVPYLFLEHRPDGSELEHPLSHELIDRRARSIAAQLQRVAVPGDRVILLYPPGPDFFSAFYGCLYAGMVAVPTYPPDPYRLERSVPRLQAIVQNAGARAVLIQEAGNTPRQLLFEHAPDLERLHWICTDELEAGAENAWERPLLTPEDVAILQYTSGSTGAPKGVVLDHGMVTRYLASLERSLPEAREPSMRGVSWLPTYHDMGLVQGLLVTIHAHQQPFVQMSPIAFLQQPFRWLDAVSRYRATYSGGPNFAYDLCVDRIPEEQRETLDLSSWDVAMLGAEPTRVRTLDRFVEAFGPRGFDRKAFGVGYGMAEATLILTLVARDEQQSVRSFDAAALEQGEAKPAPTGSASRELVGCGRPLFEDLQIRIVDPVTLRPRATGTIGEIWASGPTLARSYWNQPDRSEETFGARLEGDARDYLRTGDLGFFDDTGELYVTGRLKDLLIVRGRNLHPQDVEAVAETSHPSLRRGCSIAVSIDPGGGEEPVVVAEANAKEEGTLRECVHAIRRSVADAFGVTLQRILLIAPRTIPKTSSGKLQRSACREAIETGHLRIVASWTRGAADVDITPVS